MGRVQYSEQFKREAVRLVTEQGYSAHAAGKAVGVCPGTVRDWVAKYADEMPQQRVYASEADELASLRAENRRLKMEREILKKAAAFFAREDQS